MAYFLVRRIDISKKGNNFRLLDILVNLNIRQALSYRNDKKIP